jgi:hypothetical protein
MLGVKPELKNEGIWVPGRWYCHDLIAELCSMTRRVWEDVIVFGPTPNVDTPSSFSHFDHLISRDEKREGVHFGFRAQE